MNLKTKFFKIEPDSRHEWKAFEHLIAGLYEGSNLEYLSTPMTTGKRFIEWYKKEGCSLTSSGPVYKELHKKNVLQPNKEEARELVNRLRSEGIHILDPTYFHLPGWTQKDYYYLWSRIIELYVSRLWFKDGWEYSNGCVYEFYVACWKKIDTVSESEQVFSRKQGMDKIESAILLMKDLGIDISFIQQILIHLKNIDDVSDVSKSVVLDVSNFKDESLDELASTANVAQFVSYRPGDNPTQRFCHINGIPSNFSFSSIEEAINNLLLSSPEGTVNIMTFKPDDPSNHPFLMGANNVKSISRKINSLATQGLYTIVNETINISDNGVSGVLMNNMVEFSPDDTPRCVEKPGIARMPYENAIHILKSVYNFSPSLNYEPDLRVEFSLHPICRGVKNEHTIIWEIQHSLAKKNMGSNEHHKFGPWPNNFSRLLGDKVYGLLVADSLGLPVPYTNVTSRRLAPFSFGERTGNYEVWLRTAPSVKQPGHFPTTYGWQDPFKLLNKVDQTGKSVPSVMAQESVNSIWSGALNTQNEGPNIEGVKGFGDKFMLGEERPIKLPVDVRNSVIRLYERAYESLGPISMEWAFDGERTWVLQLHSELSSGHGDVIVEGNPNKWHKFDISKGLEKLRDLTNRIHNKNEGIELIGRVGLTSHFADVLRKAKIPSKITD